MEGPQLIKYLDEKFEEIKSIHRDHEKRIRWLEKALWRASGMVMVVIVAYNFYRIHTGK